MSSIKALTMLVKKELKVTFNGMKYHKKKGMYKASTAMIYILGAFLMGYIAFQSYMQTKIYSDIGMPSLGIEMNLLTALLFGLMLTLMQSTSTQKTNDAQLLLALPIKKEIVIISKLLSKYFYILVPVFAILFPSIVSYVIINNFHFSIILNGSIFILILPLLFTAIANLVTAFIVSISAKIRFSEHIGTILMMLFLCGYMLLTFYSSKLLTNPSPEVMQTGSLLNMFPFTTILDFIIKGNIISFIIIFACIIIPFYISILIYKKNFGVDISTYKSKNTNYIVTDTNLNKSLFKKELKRYFGCSAYVFNTIFGSVLVLLFTIMAVFNMGFFEVFATHGGGDGFNLILYAITFSFFLSISPTTATAISLEGKYLWLMKSLPIDTFKMFIAKIKVNLFITIPFITLSAIVLFVSGKLTIIDSILLFCLTTLVTVFSTFVGLIINLFCPKFDWDTEIKVVKQSTSVILTMLIGMAITALPIILYITLLINILPLYTYISIILLFFVIINVLLLLFLKNKGVKIYNQF